MNNDPVTLYRAANGVFIDDPDHYKQFASYYSTDDMERSFHDHYRQFALKTDRDFELVLVTVRGTAVHIAARKNHHNTWCLIHTDLSIFIVTVLTERSTAYTGLTASEYFSLQETTLDENAVLKSIEWNSGQPLPTFPSSSSSL